MSAGFSHTVAVLSFRALSFFPLIDEKTRIIKAPSDEGCSPQCRKNVAQRQNRLPSVSAKPKIREPMSLQTLTFITVYSLKKLFIFSEKLFFFL